MRRVFLMLCLTILLTACATGSQGYWESPHAGANRQKDDIECTAMASQAAAGAGGWSSSAPMRAAIYEQARQQYFNTCIQSRGYRWVTSR